MLTRALEDLPLPLVHHQNEARKSLRDLLGLKPAARLLGNNSALSSKFGYGYLMLRCAHFRDQGIDFHCVLAGDGPLRDELERQRIILRLDDHVSFLGSIVEEAEFLAALDVVISDMDDLAQIAGCFRKLLGQT